jgi:hypothetical protein
MPDEIACRVADELELLLLPCHQTKMAYAHMVKQRDALPEWAQSMLVAHDAAESPPEEIIESFACVECCGGSGLQLPLDPEINPQHHRFLEAMGRRQFGRVRNGRRGRRPDTLATVLRLAKHGVLFLGVARCLLELMAVQDNNKEREKSHRRREQ